MIIVFFNKEIMNQRHSDELRTPRHGSMASHGLNFSMSHSSYLQPMYEVSELFKFVLRFYAK